jgi:tryptophan-rich sensory protein
MNKITKILTVVVTCLAIGYLSGTVTRSILTWYPKQLNLVLILLIGFCLVWSTLYAMMVAAGLVWDRIDFEKR